MTDPRDPLLGTEIAGRYLIEKRLGMGGMGAVYLAAQQSLGRGVALKVLRGELVSDPVAVERFKNEAKVIAQLGHPHVVGIHDFGTTDDGVLFIAMEYLPGLTLAETVRKEGPLPWQRTVPIIRDVARALSAAHRRGVVHRDLKPENILLIEAEGLSDFVKVLDFGIAKLVRGHEMQGNLTGTGLVPGTPGYIAPEQITGSADDPRSDLYALGVTWFEMLTARRPFEAESAMKIFLAQLEGSAPRLSVAHPDVEIPSAVDDLLLSLLEREPDARPASAEELLSRLRESAECCAVLDASHVHTPAAGSLTVDHVDALQPDEPTLPALTTPLLPVPRVGTPSTGTTSAGRLVTREEERAIARKWGRRWAAAGALVCLVIGLLVAAGWEGGRLLHLLEERMPLELTSDDHTVRIEMTNALEAFYDGELDVANRAVDKVLRSSSEEPGGLVLKIAISGRMDDKFAQTAALARLGKLLQKGLPVRRDDDEALVRAVVRSARGTYDDVGRAWRECAECRETGLGNLLFSGFFAARFSHDAASGLEAAEAAIAALPRAALPVADKARFLLKRGAGGSAEESLAVVQKGLETNRGSPLLHQVKAEALLALGRYREAEKELRAALSMSVSPEADALLAQTLLLLGDENGRRGVIEAALRRSTPRAQASLAIHHGGALVGAGRLKDALALYSDAITTARESGTPADLAAASFVALDAMRAADAAHVVEQLDGIKVAAEGLLKHINLPRDQADVLKWVLHLVEGARAADEGDLATAEQKLTQLRAASSELLPPQAHNGIVGYLTYRVYLAQKQMLDEAGRAAELLGHPCSVLEAQARVAKARGNAALERERWQLVVEREGVCRLQSYGGVHSLNARAALVSLDAKAGNVAAAKEGVAEVRARYPQADADLPAMRLLAEVALSYAADDAALDEPMAP